MTDSPHLPVMLSEVVTFLAPEDGESVVDGTFGAGGYSQAILAKAMCKVFGIDRDPSVAIYASKLADANEGRFVMMEGCFGDMERLLSDRGVEKVNGITLDLGVSSMQLDQADRGFSFRKDGPLDMRMANSGSNAADLINGLPETELADIIYRYGEERHSRRIARAIVAERRNQKIQTTHQLAELVRSQVRRSNDAIDPATRTFQALRIAVNDELGELDRGLAAAERLLSPGGRLAVISFHSLEDRIVKNFLGKRCGKAANPSRHAPASSVCSPSFRLLSRKALSPSHAELCCNHRAKSAKLRVAERTSAPPWSESQVPL